MSIRTWAVLILLRLLGGRWFPLTGPSVLILRGSMAAESGEQMHRAISGLDLRIIVLRPGVSVEAVITRQPSDPLTRPADIS